MNVSKPDPQQPAYEYNRLLRVAARLRSEALRTRIMALNTFCATAESELQYNRLDKARISAGRIRHALSEIEVHLQDTHHVSSAAASELQALLERIRPRIEKLERAVENPRRPKISR